MEPIRRPEMLNGTAARRLRTAIINGEFDLGQPLSESALAASLGISKTPIREALAQLRIEGLVTVIPQKGTFVFTMSAQEVVELCELRLTLETAALRFAFQRNREPFVTALRDIAEQMTQARKRHDVREYLRLDTSYHAQFFRFCGNSYLEDAYNLIVGKVAALRTHLSVRPTHTGRSYTEHGLIVEAVRRGDLEGALAILDKHIARTKHSYAKSIEDIAAADRARYPRAAPRAQLTALP